MKVHDLADQPGLNPSLADVVARLAIHRAAGRRPRSLSMSPETWDRLRASPAGSRLCQDDADRRLDGVRVRLVDGCLGVGIGCDEY